MRLLAATCSQKPHDYTTTRAQSRRAPAPAHQILRACAVEMHFEDLDVNECTINGSDWPHTSMSTSIGHPSSTTTVRTPSVTALFGETCLTASLVMFKVLAQLTDLIRCLTPHKDKPGACLTCWSTRHTVWHLPTRNSIHWALLKVRNMIINLGISEGVATPPSMIPLPANTSSQFG